MLNSINTNKGYSEVVKTNPWVRYVVFTIIVTGLVIYLMRVLLLSGYYSNPHGNSFIALSDFKFYYEIGVSLVNNEFTDSNVYLAGPNPPFLVMLTYPLGLLTFTQAGILWSLLNLVLLVITIITLTKILAYYNVMLSKIEQYILFVTIFLFYPVSLTFFGGQLNIIILALLTLFYYFLYIKSNNTFAGVMLALASLIKVFPFAIIVLDKLQHKRRYIYQYIVLVFTPILITVWYFGLQIYNKYLIMLLTNESIASSVGQGDWNNVSPSIIILKLIGLMHVSEFNTIIINLYWTIIKFVVIVLIFYYIYKINKNIQSQEVNILTFSTLLIMPFIFAPKVWNHYGTYMIIPYVLYFFVLKLNKYDKLLLVSSILLFTFHELALFIGTKLGGLIFAFVSIASPSMFAFLLIFGLTLIKLMEINNENNSSERFVRA